LGLDNATSIIKNDDIIIVDGTTGIVIINPSDQTLIQFEERKERYESHKADITRDSHLPAETIDNHIMEVMGNIELPEEVVSVIDYGGDGIGLYRTEFQYLNRPDFPSEYELFDRYKDVVEVMAPKPVTIRTADISGDQKVSYVSQSGVFNPALGLRGIRYCLQKPDVFLTQLRAVLRASAFGNVRILLPMVSCHEEIVTAKNMLKKAADSLSKEGIPFDENIEIGVMIEVPSAVIMADVIAMDVDFFNIGTNDLIQYSLAVDRVNKDVAYLYQPLHPAIIRLVKHIIDIGKDKGIKIFICGEMASDPINIPILLGLGMENFSMNPQAIPAVKSMIRALTVQDTKSFVQKVLKETSTDAIIELVQGTYGSVLSETIYSQD
jgi:phosphotransferase system enzyme I (PtsI)